jgi:serine/threonine-protein kinase
MLPDKSPDARGATGARLLNGRYELGEKIGDGSFFSVYRGRDAQSGRPVAIKVLNEEYAGDREFVERLRSEALAATRLDHPHIVPVYDAWIEQRQVAIVAEFVRGIDLKERVRRVAPFPLAVAVDIAAAVSEALEYASAQGLSHGDLRPENILVTPEGQVKLADFGVAAAVCASSRLQISALMQSAHYLPPEVAQGQAPSARGDVYSLGVILFEMLSGQPPFHADTPFAIAVKHLHDAPPSLRRLNPGVPKAVDGIIAKCLQKDPAARYPNPAALLTDLRGVREALRFGKPLTWTPAPEPVSSTAKAPEPPPRKAAAAPAVPAAARPRPATAVEKDSHGNFSEPSIRLLVLMPLMAIFLAAAVFGMFVLSTKAPRDTTVPNIAGMTRDEAARTLTQRGLKFHVAREIFDESKPAGTIMWSDPPSGLQVKEGKAVDAAISKGPKPAVVPNVVNRPEDDARSRVREAGLKVGEVRREYDEIVPNGEVISQEPSPQSDLPRRSEVSFVVSKGPEPEPPEPPATPPEPAPTPPDTFSTDTTGTNGASTDTSTSAASTDNGTMTDTSAPGAAPPPNRERLFDLTTHIEGDKPKSRLRIVVTDENGRRQVASELHYRGETVHSTIKATGAPGSVRIEVYENGQLVKDRQY